MAHEVLLGRLRAAIAEGEVVFVRAPFVAVPADPDPQLGIRLQNRDLLIEGAHVVGADVRLVEVEVDHRGQRVPDFVGRAGQGGERIRSTLVRDALSLGGRLPFGFGVRRVDGIAHPLILGRGVDRRRRILRGRIAAARRGRNDGSAQAQREEQRYRFHPVSPIRGW